MEKRMRRTIRVYEPTAKLIEEIMRRNKDLKSFADVVEQWAKANHEDAYNVILESEKKMDDLLSTDLSEE